MNEFERRWKMGLEAARRTAPSSSEEAPFGFATRVVAQWSAQPEPSVLALWQQFAVRVLGAMAVVLVALAAYDALSLGTDAPLQPAVENAVADSFWLL